jgi:hypothetical protein
MPFLFVFLLPLFHNLMISPQPHNNILISDDTSSDAMNIEPTYRQEYAPVSSASPQCSGRVTPKGDLLGQMIPPILKNKTGLGNIPPETLRENLQPIVRALEKLDAEQLLGLQRSSRGPQVRDG